MSSHPCEEAELSKKHEEILGKRAVLLLQMESRYEQQKNKKSQQVVMSQAAQERNSRLLADLQKMENCMRTRPLPHPDVIDLETRYWASVEETLPEWEHYFLGKGKPPLSDSGRSPQRRMQKGTPTEWSPPQRDKGLPPRPGRSAV